ncbi:anchored repeat-type ABC transporter permease subunit [Actinobaculum massiliense]|uniref:Anchored repeat-type ABC transporter, permease subunit n=1 Tax=Actinobaculum massiliense ACS-171-V-Col2 TaxID=883066 RepID=K9EJJ0_9ACTO|nr:anchored repeat-type ABC transporter permease subunit [Actinobaculum massiliense]EKU96031.1 anchored repeat-type ABC transporter, permease subunit [Actinobaculum massiliense ACS-171-V-Col2]MDK8318317.1 anchored repeat-type ABC transporter permease subunit [Actinobaculum massiliense]MDK8566732.1 anchored repeat-type ABC transporter permease subunit [Actinobaculum massiliense]
MNLFDFFNDLTNPVLAFLPRALLVAMLSSLVCGVVGTHVVLRGMSFVGDALSHAVFPGIAIAFAVQGSIMAGGLVAGAIVALLIAFGSQNRKLREDSLIGIFMAASFALGIIIMSRIPGYTGSLESFLFGSLTGVTDGQLLVVAATGAVILLLVALIHPQLVASTVDRDYARTLGIRQGPIDAILYLLVAATVVISVQSIGNILVLALLVTPAATARLLTNRLIPMMLIAPALGCLSAFMGVWISWSWDWPAGASIVMVLLAVFVCAWAFSSVFGRRLVRRRPRELARAEGRA